MHLAIFAIALAALSALNILLALTAFSDTIKLWPLPARDAWQAYVFWPLFRGGLGATILFGILTFAGAHGHGWEALIGVPMALAGLALTVYGYFDLGIGKTYGGDDGLVTSGLYRYSRNPQYVSSILGFAGLAIAADTERAALLCLLAAGVYVLLPYAEEPWLARLYGARYEAYKRATPRFLSLSKLFEKPVAAER
ncbi:MULTISPECIES: PEMT/PEM2 methyltransferase family protein [Rhodomicrobium]|uniref:methyltransferase family protein n=1 Tax=Rhodomicrobium TaxID=1068 RepID=UPI000B4B9734|nr:MULTISPECIES: PEMT/PEM2 methyltransferase family protein [Rhodomicrobium]